MTAKEEAHFYFWHIAVALAVFSLLLLTIEAADLDRRISALFYDPSIRAFPWRDNWLLEKAQHVAATRAVALLGLSVLVVWLATHWFSGRSEEHTSELQSHSDLVCRLLLEKKKTA